MGAVRTQPFKRFAKVHRQYRRRATANVYLVEAEAPVRYDFNFAIETGEIVFRAISFEAYAMKGTKRTQYDAVGNVQV